MDDSGADSDSDDTAWLGEPMASSNIVVTSDDGESRVHQEMPKSTTRVNEFRNSLQTHRDKLLVESDNESDA